VVLNNLVCWAHTTGRIRIMSDGTPWRPIVHVQDIARAFATALMAPREVIHNQAFNVGANGENYQVRELAEIVRATVPRCTVEYAAGAGPDPRSYRVDFGKLSRTFPDLRPQWNAAFGARTTARCKRLTPRLPNSRAQVHPPAQIKHLRSRTAG
jgi:nucleoside-diphosphate-sugar epimerase